jgi:hypothetical protein
MNTAPTTPAVHTPGPSTTTRATEYPKLEAELRAEVERLASEVVVLHTELKSWIKAALATRLCRADVDVSTPEKYQAAQAEAASSLLSLAKLNERYARDAEPQMNAYRDQRDAVVQALRDLLQWSEHQAAPGTENIEVHRNARLAIAYATGTMNAEDSQFPA